MAEEGEVSNNNLGNLSTQSKSLVDMLKSLSDYKIEDEVNKMFNAMGIKMKEDDFSGIFGPIKKFKKGIDDFKKSIKEFNDGVKKFFKTYKILIIIAAVLAVLGIAYYFLRNMF